MLAYPEKRVLMLAMPVLLFGVFSIGVLIALLTNIGSCHLKKVAILSTILFIILSVYPITAFRSLFNMTDLYRERAQLWDNQQEEILQQIGQGKKNLTVTALDSYSEMAEMRDYDTFWVNLCVAQYYNVDTISAVER